MSTVSFYDAFSGNRVEGLCEDFEFSEDEVIPGQVICRDDGYLKGHGVRTVNGKIIATTAGVVDRINKLITVRPISGRYQGDVGDVVVGKVLKVGANRWNIDIQGRQDGILPLSGTNLPGGLLRRKTQDDALQMRNLFQEGDLISAEIQKINDDNAMFLQTRGDKYGKLEEGIMVVVPSAYIRRSKQHFHTFPFGLEIILGNNGYIFIRVSQDADLESVEGASRTAEEASVDVRRRMIRLRQCIVALSQAGLAIGPDVLLAVYTFSVQNQIAPREIALPGEANEKIITTAMINLQQQG